MSALVSLIFRDHVRLGHPSARLSGNISAETIYGLLSWVFGSWTDPISILVLWLFFKKDKSSLFEIGAKFGTIVVPRANLHQITYPYFDLMSHFQDGFRI